MQSRNQETLLTKGFSRREINEQSTTPGIMATDIWARRKTIDETLFTNSNKGQDIKVYFIDTVGLHEFNKTSREFFAQMANTEQLHLFDLSLIQSIIHFKWPIVKMHII